MLEVGDGHSIYWEANGDPHAQPILYLHGGPGSGTSDGERQMFDPHLFSSVTFDQRGSGRSTPATTYGVDLSSNTTAHLIADMELLRRRVGVDNWIVSGISWGTTLAQAYAHEHPSRVSGLVLGAVTTTSAREVVWITEGVGRIFPEEWDLLRDAIGEEWSHLSLVDAYGEMLASPDPELRDRAARSWCRWEESHVSLNPGHKPYARFEDPEFRYTFARLVTHYWRNTAFLGSSELLDRAPDLALIPAILIHGRLDVSGPLETAWQLHKSWPNSELRVLEDSGHSGQALNSAFRTALADMHQLVRVADGRASTAEA